MLTLSATIQAAAAGKSLRLAPLFFFDFLSGPRRYWIGKGNLTTGGFTWDGVPTVIGIDFGQFSQDGSAESFSIGVSGVDDTFIGKVVAGQSECIPRALQILLQFFDENWLPLDQPFQVRAGRMLGITYRIPGLNSRSVTIKCESKFTARGMPPLNFLNLAEQQRRFPGNRFLEFMVSLQNKTVQWPLLTA